MTGLLIIAVLLVVGWFAAGTIWNVRKGSAVMRWMQRGLPLLGERASVRWLGTTAVEMVIANPKPPFGKVVLILFMEPRDIPWFWWLARLRGRRDTLILRAQLRKSPEGDVEALDRKSWSGREALKRIGSERWLVRECSPRAPLPVYYKTAGALACGDAMLALASGARLDLRRLAVHHTDPHLEVHFALPTSAIPAPAFFELLRTLGERAAE